MEFGQHKPPAVASVGGAHTTSASLASGFVLVSLCTSVHRARFFCRRTS